MPLRNRLKPGDVAWGPDRFHEDDPDLVKGNSRPWLVISNDTFPGQQDGRQYLTAALTSNLAEAATMLPLKVTDWENGGGGKPRQTDTETVETVKHVWLSDYLGRVKHAKVVEARKAIANWLK